MDGTGESCSLGVVKTETWFTVSHTCRVLYAYPLQSNLL